MNHWISLLQMYRIITVIRADDIEIATKMAIAAAKGGIKLLEVTWNTGENSQEVARLVYQLRQELPNCYIGTGTILDMTMLNEAIACGCQFIFTPHVSLSLMTRAKENQIPIIPGAMTPTEIMQAWQGGADAVKIFPIKILGGSNYIKCLRPVLGNIPLIPTGGVTLTNAVEFLQAGAIAVGISTDLFLPEAVQQQNWQAITARATQLLDRVNLTLTR